MAGDLAAFKPVPKPGSVEALAPTCDDLPIGRILAEPRVLAILRTPYFTALRAIIQDEIEARASDTRKELQRDLSQQLLDVQAELKTKVNIRRLAEFLHENRDETLYGNVRNLLADVQDVKMHKVDLATFHEVLRQKADTKTLDLKADKQQVSTNVALLTGRVDNVEHEASKRQEKIVEMELRLSELIYWLHTGRSMGDTSSRMVSSHAHSELLKLRPSKNGMVDRHAKGPESVVVDGGSRRELPPGIARQPGFGPATDAAEAERALVPSVENASPARRPAEAADAPAIRSPLRRRGGSPDRHEPTPPSSSHGRHPHHPQKRVVDGSPRDHLRSSTSAHEGASRHGGPLPPAMAEYIRLVSDHPGSESEAAVAATVRMLATPQVDPEYTLSATVKAERAIPDGPGPRSRDPPAEAVSWTADATLGSEVPTTPGAAASSKNASTKPATGKATPRVPTQPAVAATAVPATRPPSGKSRGQGSRTSDDASDRDTAPQGDPNRSNSAATEDPRMRIGAWSAASATSNQSAMGARVQTSRSPDQSQSAAAAPPDSATEDDAAEATQAEAKRRTMLGPNVKTVLLKSGVVTKEQLRKNDPLHERPRGSQPPPQPRR